jgi:hypothetical protein
MKSFSVVITTNHGTYAGYQHAVKAHTAVHRAMENVDMKKGEMVTIKVIRKE